MIIDGKYVPNVYCGRCRWRHPADLTCAQAQEVVDSQGRKTYPTRLPSGRIVEMTLAQQDALIERTKTDRELIDELVERVERLEKSIDALRAALERKR
jgi:hypothetical protein